MNTSKLADIAEITSSIAILVTLVFLVVQMQQNSAALQADGRQELLVGEYEYLFRLADNPSFQLNWYESELTDEQKLQVHFMLTAFLRNREIAWLQYQNGILDDATWESYQSPIAIVLASHQARNWWRGGSESLFEPSFVANVNEMIVDVPVLDRHPALAWFD
jgi:hypothetical protein